MNKDLTGQTFGFLTVVKVSTEKKELGRKYWECSCVCGITTIIPTQRLTTGRTKSCGCKMKELNRQSNTKHGYKYSPEYQAYN